MVRSAAFLLAATSAHALVNKEFANTFSELMVLSPECSEELGAILPSKAANNNANLVHRSVDVEHGGAISPTLDPKLVMSPACRAQLLENAAAVFSVKDSGGASDDDYSEDSYDYDLGAEDSYDYALGAEDSYDSYGNYDYDLGAEENYDSYGNYDYDLGAAKGAEIPKTGVKPKTGEKPKTVEKPTSGSGAKPKEGKTLEIMVKGKGMMKCGGCKMGNLTKSSLLQSESFVSVDSFGLDSYEYGYQYDSYDDSLGAEEYSYEYDSYDDSLGNASTTGKPSSTDAVNIECDVCDFAKDGAGNATKR